jgi:hypothetical protein
MRFSCWLRSSKPSAPVARRRTATSLRRPADVRPEIESLEDRKLLTTFTAGTAQALISAINSANSAGGTHTIILSANATFSLKSANNSTHGPTGLPVIGAERVVDLTILGNGGTIARTAGYYNKQLQPIKPFRLFDVAPGASLTLDRVKLEGGWAYDSAGGAVYNQGTLNVSGGTFYLNMARYGGVIYNAGGTATMSDSRFVGGSVQVADHIVVASNSATAGGGAVTISSTILSDSSTNGTGGGIHNRGGTVTVTNGSTLTGNIARDGGGIYNDQGTVTVSNGSTLSGNMARWGYNFRGLGNDVFNSSAGSVTVKNSSACARRSTPRRAATPSSFPPRCLARPQQPAPRCCRAP